MIASFHPCFEADENRICAGRLPNADDLALIRSADAVILPQGCSEALYRMAHDYCSHVFPNYNARFGYPGKSGQVKLFRKAGALHPETIAFDSLDVYGRYIQDGLPFSWPMVLKLDWGGEGDNVHLISNAEALERALNHVRACEASGQKGFLLQEYIASGNRSLRVVVIHRYMTSYWRTHNQPGNFYASLAGGAHIDRDSDITLQALAVQAVRTFCDRTGIDLAGFDLLFSETDLSSPLFLEINYFFGRQGLGGSEAYYTLLLAQIRQWLLDQGLL
jgi:ribosomal protein S6--L-glutamate ligase